MDINMIAKDLIILCIYIQCSVKVIIGLAGENITDSTSSIRDVTTITIYTEDSGNITNTTTATTTGSPITSQTTVTSAAMDIATTSGYPLTSGIQTYRNSVNTWTGYMGDNVTIPSHTVDDDVTTLSLTVDDDVTTLSHTDDHDVTTLSHTDDDDVTAISPTVDDNVTTLSLTVDDNVTTLSLTVDDNVTTLSLTVDYNVISRSGTAPTTVSKPTDAPITEYNPDTSNETTTESNIDTTMQPSAVPTWNISEITTGLVTEANTESETGDIYKSVLYWWLLAGIPVTVVTVGMAIAGGYMYMTITKARKMDTQLVED